MALICETLGVSRSGFYAWLTRPRGLRAQRHEELSDAIRRSFLDSDRTYGARRVWHDLLAAGVVCGLHAVERLMRLSALRARPRRRRLPTDTGVRPATELAANVLNRQFTAPAPNRKWVADFTYILDGGGMALRGRRSRPLLAPDCGMVDGCCNDGRARHGCSDDGALAARTPERAAAPLRSRQPVYERAVSAADGRCRNRVQSVALGQCLG